MANYPGYPDCLKYPYGPNYNHNPCKDYEDHPLHFRTEIEVGEDGKRTVYLKPRKSDIGHCFLKAEYQAGRYAHGGNPNDLREKIDVKYGTLHILYITDNGSGLDICDVSAGESWHSGSEELVAIYGTRAEAQLFLDLYPDTHWPDTL